MGVAGAVWAEGKAGERLGAGAVLTKNLAKHSAPIFAHAGRAGIERVGELDEGVSFMHADSCKDKTRGRLGS